MDELNLALLFFARDTKPLMAWPLYNFDVKGKISELESLSDEWIKKVASDVRFLIKTWVKNEEDLNEVLRLKHKLDGVVVFILTTSLNYPLLYKGVNDLGKPTLILTEPYHSLAWPQISELMKSGKPILGISSSNVEDFIAGLKALYTYLKLLKRMKVLVITTPEESTLQTLHSSDIYAGDRVKVPDYYSRISEFLNIEFINYEDFRKFMDEAPQEDVKKLAQDLIKHAYWIREDITQHDVENSIKIYLTTKKLLIMKHADAVAFNCFTIMLKDLKALPTTPCVAVSLLNDEGIPTACEADLSSLLLQIIFKYLSGRPSWISDPVVDFSDNSIIYAHCTAPTRMNGYRDEAEPYALDTHDESGKPLVIRTKMSQNVVITSAQISPDFKQIIVGVSKISDTPVVELACRTKIKIHAKDVKKYLWEFKPPLHRVIVYGDLTKELSMLAKLMGLEFVYEY